MLFNKKILNITNSLRIRTQEVTETVDEGESVAIALWLSFIQDHAKAHDLDPKELAVKQLNALLESKLLDEGSLLCLVRSH